MLNTIKKEIKKMYQLMYAYKKYGSYDTEPCAIFAIFLQDAIHTDTDESIIPSDWDLYDTSMNTEGINKILTKQATAIFHAIKNVTLKEYKMVKEYLEYLDRCGRV